VQIWTALKLPDGWEVDLDAGDVWRVVPPTAGSHQFVERWIHHSQIRRALGLGSVSDRRFLRVGVEVVAAAFGVEYRQVDGQWELNGVVLGEDEQTSAILTRGHTVEEIRSLVTGRSDRVELLAMVAGRP
jgi:hypothetical protein